MRVTILVSFLGCDTAQWNSFWRWRQ